MSAALRNASLKTERETTMKTNKKNSGIKVNAGVKSGSLNTVNHNRNGLRVRAGVKAGTMIQSANHNVRLLALT